MLLAFPMLMATCTCDPLKLSFFETLDALFDLEALTPPTAIDNNFPFALASLALLVETLKVKLSVLSMLFAVLVPPSACFGWILRYESSNNVPRPLCQVLAVLAHQGAHVVFSFLLLPRHSNPLSDLRARNTGEAKAPTRPSLLA